MRMRALTAASRSSSMSAALNPVKMAAMQSQPTADDGWAASINRIMALTAGAKHQFASQPFANRLDAILEAVVPSRKDPTHEKVLTIVNALIENGAIRRDEGAGVFDALLARVSKYNSMNAQSNLERLAGDVREAVAQKVRIAEGNLGSLAALNGFLARLPANVERGQENYTGFLSALKLLVSEVPNTEVYQAGPHYFLQSNRNGTQTVNLTAAFENLKPLWGVRAPTMERLSISALLTPNTRLLLLLVSPFTDSVSISRDSYIGYLLTLYREALGRAHLDERTLQEVTQVSRAFGQDGIENLQATLNFLLTNRQKRLPREYSLTAEEERILRFVQQAVSLRMMQENLDATEALDVTVANLEPTFYASNRDFINKLMDYFHRAAAMAPDYFLSIVMNPRWLPPEGFFTGTFDFPERDEYAWDGLSNSVDMTLRDAAVAAVEAKFLDDDQRVESRDPSRATTPAPSRRPSVDSGDFMSLVRNNATAEKNVTREVDSLADKLARWKTYKREVEEARAAVPSAAARPKDPTRYRSRSPFGSDDSDDGMGKPDKYLKFEGSGNPFAHLRPQQGRRLFRQ
ncbi:capsid protein precursor pIIIa [bat adenovirus 3]|uniref:Pre-hexon-linking protein IIIa n=1 Tax=bat adenovirus 3 TaxID=2758098 RepID=D3X7B6_9ADEN|nr:capsid protein precursor pIIIa [bat adenovirus 3]ADD17105.1 capsid protein precursor pIIIa [bat adenovirus 3]